MLNDISMLNSIRKTTQMGCYGIQTVLNETEDHEMQTSLRSQLREYENLYSEADRLLRERKGRVQNVSPIARYGSMIFQSSQRQRQVFGRKSTA